MNAFQTAILAIALGAACFGAPSLASTGGVPVYPGATQTNQTSYGTPPPGATAYVTTDDPVTVAKWYEAKVSDIAVAAAVTAKGGLLLVGDQNTGTFITLIGETGKTYILLTPASTK